MGQMDSSEELGLLKPDVVPAVWRGLCHHCAINTPIKSKAFSKALTSALVFLGDLQMFNRAPESLITFSRTVPCPVIVLSVGGWQGGDS